MESGRLDEVVDVHEELETTGDSDVGIGGADPLVPVGRRRLAAWASTMVVGFGLVSCGGDGGHTLGGTFTLVDSDGIVGDWDSCSGDGGYSDFGAAMDVTVRDGDGNVMASTRTRHLSESDKGDLDAEDLDESDDVEVDNYALALQAMLAEESDGRCVVAFETEVDQADFYQVEVGRRGDLTYSYDDLEEQDWWISLTLGD